MGRGNRPPVICPYCGKEAELTSSKRVYGGRDYGPIYLCTPCWAYVGCHKGTIKPIGRLANAELREWKKLAHDNFDPLWQDKILREGCSKGAARSAGYKWLADSLGIELSQCHIGMFDAELCKRTIELCRPYRRKISGQS